MSDSQLELLSKTRRTSYGLSPWAAFEVERTSFGREIRKRGLYPSFLPLMISADHYVDTQSSLRPNEVCENSNARRYGAYLTWNEYKKNLINHQTSINAYFVKHPWLSSRARRQFPKQRKKTTNSGCIFFWPHSRLNFRVIMDLPTVKKKLSEIADCHETVSICLSSHDIQLGIHAQLRSLGFPLVTAGDVCSQSFVDRFYGLLSLFRFAAGTGLATQAFYCLEARVPYLIIENLELSAQVRDTQTSPWKLYSGSRQEYPNSCMNHERELVEKILKCPTSVHGVDMRVGSFADIYMGRNSRYGRFHLILLLWRQLWINRMSALHIYALTFRQILRRVFCRFQLLR